MRILSANLCGGKKLVNRFRNGLPSKLIGVVVMKVDSRFWLVKLELVSISKIPEKETVAAFKQWRSCPLVKKCLPLDRHLQ